MRYANIIDAIGNTPLVEISRLSPKAEVRIFAKLEGYNPTGSVKDRAAKFMVERAEKSGELTKDRIILEPTSGNTGIGLAMIGRYKGYRVEVVMPESVSIERRQLLELFGAKVHLSDGLRGTNGSIEVAERMAAENPQYLLLYQYGNPANPQAHYDTTGPEIVRDMEGLNIDVFIAGLGTGGTLMGVGRYLKERSPATRIIGVVPHPGDLVQGLRSLDEGFIPPILDETLLDGKIVVTSEDSFRATRELTRQEGIFAGISAGAVIHCARRIAQRMDQGNIVVLLADGGWKYLSTNLWTQETEKDEGINSKVWW